MLNTPGQLLRPLLAIRRRATRRRPTGPRRRRGQQPGRPAPRRRCYDHLRAEDVIHKLEETPSIPSCGASYDSFDDETSEELHFEVRVLRRIHPRNTYRRRCSCATTPGIVAAPPPPKPIPKGRLSIRSGARLVCYKHGLGLDRSTVGIGEEPPPWPVSEDVSAGRLRFSCGAV